MKITDYIAKQIMEYPTLYKSEDYEQSKLKVLCQIFFTIGNGLELAQTGDESTGGYVVEPRYEKDKNDEYFRLMDNPYGVDTHPELPKDYFQSKIYYVYGSARPEIDIRDGGDYGRKEVYYRFNNIKEEWQKPSLYEAFSEHKFHPYPFSKDYSLACDVLYKDVKLQPDWMAELVILCKETLKFYSSDEDVKRDGYYPTENRVKMDVRHFEDTFKKEGKDGIVRLRELWGYAKSEEVPTAEEITQRKTDAFDKYREKQLEFLNSFLAKFGN